MRKKNEWFEKHIDAHGKNWLQIDDSCIGLCQDKDKKVEVKIYDHESNLTGKYSQVRGDQVSDGAKIILRFVTKKPADHVNEKREVKYYLAKDPENEKELEKLRNQAHQKYILEKLVDETGKAGEDMVWTIRRAEDDGQIKLEITNENDPSKGIKTIKSDQLEILAEFNLIEKVTIDETIDYPTPEKEKSRWTPGWIAFVTILVTILLLIVVFWKKIWKWFRGEREQEKKVREQIDIF